jgi:hypothetical protein
MRSVVAMAGVMALAASGLAQRASRSSSPQPNRPAPGTGAAVDTDQVRAGLVKAPLAFVANTGTLDERVAFWLPGSSASVFLTDAGLTYRLSSPPPSPRDTGAVSRPLTGPVPSTPAWVVRQDFLGAAAVRPVAAEVSPTAVNFFKGSPDQWRTSVPTAASVRYTALWPGIDATYAGTGERLKYEFTVAPGADPAAIRLAYRGAQRVTLTPQGELAVDSPAGGFTDAAPTAYQDIDGGRVPVAVSYALDAPEADGSQPYHFVLGPYDPSRPLIVDPATIVYAGFIGGDNQDRGFSIAVDTAGAAYVTGITASTETTFPVAVGPDLTANGNYDAFVAKVAPGGATLVYAGFIGGSGADQGNGIAVDAAGAAYITGFTGPSAGFPVIVGPDLTANGILDAFVAKVAPGGTLVYAGFIGGSSSDVGNGIAVDTSGAAYITGFTESTGATFPVTVGPDLTLDGRDAFVAKVDPGGATLAYAGFIGGSEGADEGNGITVDTTGAAYVTGITASTETTFPVVVGPDLTANGNFDAFVAKVAPGGAGLAYAGFIGGSGDDVGNGITVDTAGAAYVTGRTGSTGTTFPATVGPDLTANGGDDAFVAKVAPAGATLVYAGFIGGSGTDVGNGIAVDAAGAAYVTGYTSSAGATFPVTVGPDLTFGGSNDAFVAKLAPGGTTFVYVGYIGGTGGDQGNGIAVDSAGAAYVTGITSSTEATFPVTVGPDLMANGDLNAFVAKVANPLASLPAVVRASTTWIRADAAASGAGTFTSTYGTRPLTPMYGDWDGNGSETPGTYEAGVFKIRNDHLGGAPEATFSFGSDPRGFAVAGDFNGDGTDDVAVFRSGLWQVRYSTGATTSFNFQSGTWPSAVPVAGDWDGDGTDGVGTYFYANGGWSLLNTISDQVANNFVFWAGPGTASYPVVGDWDANGSDTVGVKAGTTWYLSNTNGPGLAVPTLTFGLATDLPLSWR